MGCAPSQTEFRNYLFYLIPVIAKRYVPSPFYGAVYAPEETDLTIINHLSVLTAYSLYNKRTGA